MLKHGFEQSDKLIIEQPNLTDTYILARIFERISNLGENISEVWIKEVDNIRLIYQKK